MLASSGSSIQGEKKKTSFSSPLYSFIDQISLKDIVMFWFGTNVMKTEVIKMVCKIVNHGISSCLSSFMKK